MEGKRSGNREVIPSDVALRLEEHRVRIDELDAEIVRLLNVRATSAGEIGRLKKTVGMETYQPARERAVLERVRDLNGGPLSSDAVTRVFERIIDESRRLERTMCGSD